MDPGNRAKAHMHGRRRAYHRRDEKGGPGGGSGSFKKIENMFITLMEEEANSPGSRVVVRKGKMRICKKRGIFEAF